MARRTKDMIFEESLFNNMEDYLNLKSRLIALTIGRLHFKNLPDYIYEPFILRTIICNPETLFAYDPDLDRYFWYIFTYAGRLNEYNIPFERRITLNNVGYTNTFDDSNSVIFRSSLSGTPLIPIIEEYARKLFIISRTIDVNVNAQKTPVMVLCEEDQRLTFTNMMKQYAGNVPFIFGDKNIISESNFKVLDLKAPFVADKLFELKTNLWNEFLTFLGIYNVSINKKERLITDEVNRSMGGVLVARNDFIRAINESVEAINNKFGLDIEFIFGEDDNKDSNGEDPDIEIEEKEEIE